MARHVLVPGGAGYIGSHTCKALAAARYTPVAYDNLVYGHRWAVRWGPLIVGDLVDAELLQRVLCDYQVAAIMHFAAYAYVGESMAEPGKYVTNNVVGSINLLKAAHSAGVRHMVFSSTCVTYGLPDMPSAIQAALGRRACVEIYGADYSTADDAAIRDYIHVTDLAAAHIAALYYLLAGASSVAHLAPLCGRLMRSTTWPVPPLPYITSSTRCIRLKTSMYGSIKVLGWEPKVTLHDGSLIEYWGS